jgi:tetratricopeptide (TPR) repeat protein
MKTTSIVFLIAAALFAASCATPGPASREPTAEAGPGTQALERTIASAPSARDFMVDLLKTKKLVFLGELHVTVDPILFLAENLRSFHDAGLRYLFYEGGMPGYAPAVRGESRYSEPYFIFFVAPWRGAGWKYEGWLLSKAIRDLNSGVPAEERIRLIAAEGGLDESGLSGNMLLSSRDAYAFDTVSAAMDASREGDKGLIFYGQGHGLKAGASPPTMAGLLAARYGDSFASVCWSYLDGFDGVRDPASLRIDRDRGIPIAFYHVQGFRSAAFDASIVDLDPATYGVCYQYVQTKENLAAMYRTLRGVIEAQPGGDDPLASALNRSEYFLTIYYLKLYYGERFDYDLWNPEGGLKDALEDMKPIFIGPKADPVAALEVKAPESLETMEEYHKRMYEPMEGRPEIDALKSYEKAVAIFPQDLWASYGLSIALMDRGDYEGALAVLELMLEKRLSRCMDRLPDIYDRAAECAQVLGMEDRAADFRRSRAELVSERGLEPQPWSR